jgi:hypothetical protein
MLPQKASVNHAAIRIDRRVNQMAYYQTQPMVPNAFYVDIIGGSSGGTAGGAAMSALQSNVTAQQTIIDTTTATANIDFLTAFTAGGAITLGSSLALSNNVQLTTLDSVIGGGAALRSTYANGAFIGINGQTGFLQAGVDSVVQQTMSTGATHYVSSSSSFYRLTVEGAVYASSFNTLCPYRVLIDNSEVLHISEEGNMFLKEGAQIYIGGRRLRLEGLLE